jgi:hypothetical protein
MVNGLSFALWDELAFWCRQMDGQKAGKMGF